MTTDPKQDALDIEAFRRAAGRAATFDVLPKTVLRSVLSSSLAALYPTRAQKIAYHERKLCELRNQVTQN